MADTPGTKRKAVKVLAVEDSPTQALEIQRVLEQAGYEVTLARDGEEALRALEGGAFDIVVTDIVMPGMSGYDLCRRVKAERRWRDTPVVLLTTLHEASDIVEGLACGADNFVTKPFEPEHLLARVRNILESHRMRAEGKLRMGVEVLFLGKKFTITSEREQILDLLIATFEDIVQTNRRLLATQAELEEANAKIQEHARRLEGEVQVSGDRYERLLSAIPDIVAEVDARKVYTWVNRPGLEFFGEGVIGREAAFYFEGEQDTYRRVQQIFDGSEDMVHLESWQRRRDGEKRLLAWQCRAVKDAGGRVTGALSTARDITRADRARREREVTRDLLLMLNSNKETRGLLEAAAGLLQEWSGCEAVGIRFREGDDYPYLVTRGFPETFVRTENTLCARDPDGRIVCDEAGRAELECMCGTIICGRIDPGRPFFTPSGSFWTNGTTALLATTTDADRRGWTRNVCNREGYESVALVPLRVRGEPRALGLLQLNDRRTGMFTPAHIDILERLASIIAGALTERQAERALRESEERFRAVAQTAADAIVSADAAGNIAGWHGAAERLFGYAEAEVTGRPLAMLMPPRYRDRHAEGLARLMAGSEPHVVGKSVEMEGLRKDGSEFPLELSLAAWEATGGRFATAIIRDITDRRRLQAQFHQAQKMEAVGRLAGGVVHDFNNLLTVINGYVSMALSNLREDDPLVRNLGEVHKAGERAAALTRQLLTFSRKQAIDPQVLNLNWVVAGTEKLLHRLIGEDIDLLTLQAPDLGRVRADTGQIEQVLMNLAVNSRDAMPDGGKLTIETANVDLDDDEARRRFLPQSGPHVLLAVSDTGIGMDEKTQARIFEPFFTTKEVGKGTGLGLATVYGIVKQSRGSIFVYSEPGHGTTFKIYLPRIDEEAGGPKKAGARDKVVGGSETILVVEDNDPVRSLACSVLRDHGYRVLEARLPEEGIALFKAEHRGIALLVTDIVMPGMSGHALARALAPLRPGMKVLYMSGYTDDAIVRQGVLDSGLHFLQKPFAPEELARRVRQALDENREGGGP